MGCGKEMPTHHLTMNTIDLGYVIPGAYSGLSWIRGCSSLCCTNQASVGALETNEPSVAPTKLRLVHFLLWQAAKPSGDKCTPLKALLLLKSVDSVGGLRTLTSVMICEICGRTSAAPTFSANLSFASDYLSPKLPISLAIYRWKRPNGVWHVSCSILSASRWAEARRQANDKRKIKI